MRFVCLSYAPIELSQHQKEYPSHYGGTIAIADENDLRLIEDMVRPSQTLTWSLCETDRETHARRIPSLTMLWRRFCVKRMFPRLLRMAVCVLCHCKKIEGMQEELSATFDSHDTKAPGLASQ